MSLHSRYNPCRGEPHAARITVFRMFSSTETYHGLSCLVFCASRGHLTHFPTRRSSDLLMSLHSRYNPCRGEPHAARITVFRMFGSTETYHGLACSVLRAS